MGMTNAERQKRFRERRKQEGLRLKYQASNASDDDTTNAEFLELINQYYRAGVMQLVEEIGASPGVGVELARIAAEQVIDRHVSWLDVLNLAKKEGLEAACAAFDQVARDHEANRPKPEAPQPPQPTKRRVTRNKR